MNKIAIKQNLLAKISIICFGLENINKFDGRNTAL